MLLRRVSAEGFTTQRTPDDEDTCLNWQRASRVSGVVC